MTPSLQAVRALNNARLARILAGAPSLTEEEQAEIVERELHAERMEEALKNILLSSKWSHTPPTAYANIAREGLGLPHP